MTDTIRLADIPRGPDDHDGDPGTDWHPRPDKAEARNADGHLVDLADDQVAEHLVKPESADQYDGHLTRERVGRDLGAAEASDLSPVGIV